MNQAYGSSSSDDLNIDTDRIAELSKAFKRDSQYFGDDIEATRNAMAAGAKLSGTPGWVSAGASPSARSLFETHAGALEAANDLMKSVTKDLHNIGRTTEALTVAFGDTDGVNAAGLRQIRQATNLPELPTGQQGRE